jgi:hypothetical protein
MMKQAKRRWQMATSEFASLVGYFVCDRRDEKSSVIDWILGALDESGRTYGPFL